MITCFDQSYQSITITPNYTKRINDKMWWNIVQFDQTFCYSVAITKIEKIVTFHKFLNNYNSIIILKQFYYDKTLKIDFEGWFIRHILILIHNHNTDVSCWILCSICVDNFGKKRVNFGQISLFVLNLCWICVEFMLVIFYFITGGWHLVIALRMILNLWCAWF